MDWIGSYIKGRLLPGRHVSDQKVQEQGAEGNNDRAFSIADTHLFSTPKPNEIDYHLVCNRSEDCEDEEDMATAPATIVTYPFPSIYNKSVDYEITVNGISIPIVSYPSYDYVHFSRDGRNKQVNISVKLLNNPTISSHRLSPRRLNMKPTIAGDVISWTVTQDAYLFLKLNSRRELIILADPPECNVPPPLGSNVFNIAEARYNADPTGKVYSTTAIQSAIDDASASIPSPNPGAQQAVVYIPPGIYLAGNLILKSNVAVYMEGGSVLRFTGIHKDYTIHWHKDSQQRDITWWISTEFNSSNIKLYGRGTIDGNGAYSTSSAVSPRIGNNTVVPIATEDFTLDGLIVRDSGSWSITPIRSSRLRFLNLKMLNRLDQGENDCIDPMECDDVLVKHAIGISLDDPFSTKTWGAHTDIAPSWPGEPRPLTNVLFDDIISWTRCFGMKVGQGVVQPQRNITYRNGVVYDAAIGMGINHRYGVEAAEDILFEKCDVERVSLSLVGRRSWFSIFTEVSGANGVGPVRGVEVRDCRVDDRGTTHVEMKGYNQDSMVEGVVFRRVVIGGSVARTVEEVGIDPAKVAWVEGLEVVPE